MKKLLMFFLLTGVFTFFVHAQQWVSFSNQKPGAPEINLLTSNAQTVSFEITIPGIYTQDTVVNGIAFTRLILSGGSAGNPVGAPEIPALRYKIAVPVCAATEIETQVVSRQSMAPCWVYPVPEVVQDKNGILVEQFSFNPNAYTQPHIPELVAAVTSEGMLRTQRFVEVIVKPVEFCPVTKQLSVIDKVTITLEFTKSEGELEQDLGLFNSVAAAAFINIKPEDKPSISYPPGGSVRHINLTDTAQACKIGADYIIITDAAFYKPNDPNSQLRRLANHRKNYNGFHVGIVNVEQILSLPFFFEGQLENPIDTTYKKEQKIRTFLRRVYEGARSPNGDLTFILLVGDNYAENTGMPTSFAHNVVDHNDYKLATDYQFSCLLKIPEVGYADWPTQFIGRMSVENDTHLFNMVQKTINHETEYSPKSWRKSAGFTYGVNTVLNIYDRMYCNHMQNLVNNFGWNCSIANIADINNNNDVRIPTLEYFNSGTAFVQYFGYCGYPEPCHTSWINGLSQSYFSQELHNDYKAPFISAIADRTGQFDDAECLGEFLTRYNPVKGAVGYIGYTRRMSYTLTPLFENFDLTDRKFQERLPYLLFNNTTSIAGTLLTISKFNTPDYDLKDFYGYNLLGDPALNIMAHGYEVTRNVTADAFAEISSPVRVHKGATLTIPNNGILVFSESGKLIIEENGSLVIGNQAQIIEINNESDIAIHVKGGGFSVGANVTFQGLENGILLENNRNTQGLPLYDDNKQYNLSNTTFNNTPIIHRGSRLNISNCTFNPGSHVKNYISKSVIDNCTFSQTTFLSDQSGAEEGFNSSTTVSNSTFVGNNINTALQLKGSTGFNINSNTITGYETGIFMDYCGITQSGFNMYLTSINGNIISKCGTAGIEVYNSTANFTKNHIYKNFYGVRLFNNSHITFGPIFAPAAPPYQVIRDCKSIELYTSACSFPTFFRYNLVIDEDNGGNSDNDPLVWWDIKGKFIKPDITYNCWGTSDPDPLEDFFPASAFLWNPTWCPGGLGPFMLGTDETLYQTALEYFANEDYLNAETTFKELIETYPESQFAIAALHELFALEQFTNNDFTTLQNYFASIAPEDTLLFNTADFLSTRCYVKDKIWQPAIDWYEYRIENPPSYQDSIFAVIDLGDIHLKMEAEAAADTMNGNGEYSKIMYRYRHDLKLHSKKEYEEKKTALLATLPQIKKPQQDNPQTGKPQTDKKGALGQNVPNPATGITTIGYDIYTEGIVEIKVYNIVGQIMQTLPQGKQQPGSYQAKVSVSGMPAGMYHYALFVNGEKVDAKKMVVN